ncbi:cation:proton antiporter [Jidongwangia harbinensis]|uniref:cation:proton antiporter n=1 Tax=Jidongwangia harbinensis TaxID=2878561 RepID=UPI001CDA520D|nr:cation:proton antiporter [Jidongwangia harbinensis]MCA2211680.1 cation:proton antiporter [Jidongwangia harbinensis]
MAVAELLVMPPAGPAVRVLAAVALVVAGCAAAGAVARRLGQPPVIGEIAAGILLGPSVLGAVWPAGERWLFGADLMAGLSLLAQLGAILFVFLAGAELRPAAIRAEGRLTLAVSQAAFAVPLGVGVLLALPAHATLAPAGVGTAPFALFLGVAMTITAVPVLARILMDTGMCGNRVAVVAMTCATTGDALCWVVLAAVPALLAGAAVRAAATTVVLTLAVVAAVLFALVQPGLRRMSADGGRYGVPVVLAGLLLTAAVTEWAGAHAIVGAFLFGVAFPGDSPLGHRVRGAVEGLLFPLLLPLFFVHSGLRTDLGGLTSPELWLWCAVILLVAVGVKSATVWLTARLAGADRSTAAQLGVLLNCRGMTELVVLSIGLELGVIHGTTYTIFVIMALVSTAMTAPLLRRIRGTDVPPYTWEDHHDQNDAAGVADRRAFRG